MKVIHLSDTHLGYRQFHKIDPEAGFNQREQDVYGAFEQAIEKIIELEPDLVLHAGDLFDTVRPSNRAINKATELFARLSGAEIPTVLIAGNHDTPKIATTGTIMQSLDALDGINAVTSDMEREKGGYRKIEVGEAAVHAVSDAPTSDELHGRLDKIEPDSNARWNLLLLHAGIERVAADVYSGEFNEHYIPENLLEQLGMDYVALGHFHRRMTVGGSENIRYSGGTERFSFNEANYQPGFLELDFGEEISVEEHKLQTRPFIAPEEIDGEGKSARELADELEKNIPLEKAEGALVSFTITNLDETVRAGLEESYLEDLRDKAFETEIKLINPEGESRSGEDLEFKDLRQEYTDFLEAKDLADEEEAEKIKETGIKYLARVIEKEDKV